MAIGQQSFKALVKMIVLLLPGFGCARQTLVGSRGVYRSTRRGIYRWPDRGRVLTLNDSVKREGETIDGRVTCQDVEDIYLIYYVRPKEGG